MTSSFAARLLAWQRQHGRHDLPWQHPRLPYRVWLSEIMLQQTQVATVIGYFQRFVSALPDLPSLAHADLDQVLALWSGLGYYSRARNLHRTAQICLQRHGGDLPNDAQALQALPGIGRSTAHAILAQAHGQRHAILDGNVKRLLCRFHGIEGWPGSSAVQKQLWNLAESHLPASRLPDYTQAQMDLGATVCRPRKPNCSQCPLRTDCVALASQRVDQLPTSAPKRSLPLRNTCMLLIRNHAGAILLQQRPAHGIWPGLWSLPESANPDEAAHWINTRLLDAKPTPAPAGFIHSFSHYRLRIEPMCWLSQGLRARIGETDTSRWVGLDDLLKLGMPQPVRRLIAAKLTADTESSAAAQRL